MLQVGGLVVSGKLISKAAYFDDVYGAVRAGMTDQPTVEGLANVKRYLRRA